MKRLVSQAEVETIKDQVETGKRKLSFEGLNGNLIERYYEPTDNADVNILRNILEDTLDEYSDLSANDRVAVLLETGIYQIVFMDSVATEDI